MARVAVGMEINERAITVVQLKQGRKGPLLDGYARVPLRPGVVTRTGAANGAGLQKAVVDALQQAKAGRVNVCMSVTSEFIDIRELSLPPMPERELLQSIRWELKQYVGFAAASSDDIVLDYEFISTGPGQEQLGAAPGQNMLVVSAPRNVLYEYLTPLHDARIFPEIVDVGAFSLPWAAPRGGGVGYIQLGPAFIHCLLMENGEYRLSRHVPVDLGAVLDRASGGEARDGGGDGGGARSGLAALEAAFDKPQADGGPDGGPDGKVLREIVGVIIQTLEYFRVRQRVSDVGEHVRALVVSGEGALVDGLVPFVAQRARLPVAAIEPVIGPDSATLPAGEAPLYAVALGLAQRGLVEL